VDKVGWNDVLDVTFDDWSRNRKLGTSRFLTRRTLSKRTCWTRGKGRYLQETIGLTAGNLSQHIRVLEDAGFVKVEKGVGGRRPRTWVAMTRAGKTALHHEIAALKALVDRYGATGKG
jgi:DNA-binding MarR family transcriptional regulator